MRRSEAHEAVSSESQLTVPQTASCMDRDSQTSLRGRREELKGDVVRVSKRQARSVRRIDNASIGYAELVEPRLPLLELTSIAAGKRQMVQTQTALVEWKGVSRIGELMQTHEGLTSHEPDHVPESAGVFVEDRFRAEQLLVPRHATSEIADRKCHVGNGRELGHERLRSNRVGTDPNP